LVLRRDAALVGGLAVAFAFLFAMVLSGHPTPADRWLADRIQGIPWGPFAIIPHFGSDFGGGIYGFYVVPAVAAAFLAFKRQWVLLGLLAAVFLLHYVMISPKQFVAAYRPSPVFGVEGAGGLQSFPSGHVEWAVSFYGLLAYMVARALPRARGLIIGVYALVVVATALGRIELGRHWPIDTVAGLLSGLIALCVLVIAHRWFERRVQEHRVAPVRVAP
jgi:undecaprenyl-diphosphatase